MTRSYYTASYNATLHTRVPAGQAVNHIGTFTAGVHRQQRMQPTPHSTNAMVAQSMDGHLQTGLLSTRQLNFE